MVPLYSRVNPPDHPPARLARFQLEVDSADSRLRRIGSVRRWTIAPASAAMSPPPRRNRMFHPAAAGAVLDSLTRKMGVHERLEPYRAWKVWAEVVGPQTAQHAQPFRLRAGVLEVRVDHPVWMQQLQLLKPRILERLNRAIAPGVLEDIHLRHGQPEIPVPVTPSEEKQSLPLTTDEQEELDRLLPPDEDDLHSAWRKLLAHHLQSKNPSRP